MMVTSMLYLTLTMNYFSITIFSYKIPKVSYKYPAYRTTFRLMAENVITSPRESRKLMISKRGFQAAFFDRCLHYGRRGVSISQPVTYVTILNLVKKKEN